tara:strand:- start:374 stop:577 length:204 start_codon:yes stop_codon:yes gene_type:complete
MRSFHQFQTNRKLPQHEATLEGKVEELNAITFDNEEDIATFYHIREQQEELRVRVLLLHWKLELLLN